MNLFGLSFLLLLLKWSAGKVFGLNVFIVANIVKCISHWISRSVHIYRTKNQQLLVDWLQYVKYLKTIFWKKKTTVQRLLSNSLMILHLQNFFSFWELQNDASKSIKECYTRVKRKATRTRFYHGEWSIHFLVFHFKGLL